jgi:hypothetical protein
MPGSPQAAAVPDSEPEGRRRPAPGLPVGWVRRAPAGPGRGLAGPGAGTGSLASWALPRRSYSEARAAVGPAGTVTFEPQLGTVRAAVRLSLRVGGGSIMPA